MSNMKLHLPTTTTAMFTLYSGTDKRGDRAISAEGFDYLTTSRNRQITEMLLQLALSGSLFVTGNPHNCTFLSLPNDLTNIWFLSFSPLSPKPKQKKNELGKNL